MNFEPLSNDTFAGAIGSIIIPLLIVAVIFLLVGALGGRKLDRVARSNGKFPTFLLLTAAALVIISFGLMLTHIFTDRGEAADALQEQVLSEYGVVMTTDQARNLMRESSDDERVTYEQLSNGLDPDQGVVHLGTSLAEFEDGTPCAVHLYWDGSQWLLEVFEPSNSDEESEQ